VTTTRLPHRRLLVGSAISGRRVCLFRSAGGTLFLGSGAVTAAGRGAGGGTGWGTSGSVSLLVEHLTEAVTVLSLRETTGSGRSCHETSLNFGLFLRGVKVVVKLATVGT